MLMQVQVPVMRVTTGEEAVMEAAVMAAMMEVGSLHDRGEELVATDLLMPQTVGAMVVVGQAIGQVVGGEPIVRTPWCR